MLRGLALSTVLILLLSSASFASIGQAQGYMLVAPNWVFRTGPQGTATGGNTATIGHSQNATDPGGTVALQEETGILTQSASASGSGGITQVDQQTVAEGNQMQNKSNPQQQIETTILNLKQCTSKFHGTGAAMGGQGFVGTQNQTIAGPGGTSAESQIVGAAQYSTIEGGDCSEGQVNQDLVVTVTQSNNNSPCGQPPCP